MHGIREYGAGVAVCEVHELEGHALLVGCDAVGGEEEVDEAVVAWAFGSAGVVGGRKGLGEQSFDLGWVCGGCGSLGGGGLAGSGLGWGGLKAVEA